MKINRRSFLRGALSATILPRCGDWPLASAETEAPRTEFPVLLLELCGKYPGEEGSRAVTHLCARRMVTVDLEDEDAWGDINVFWAGTEMAWGLGNDVDGYWKIERAFEMVEPHVELHESKFPVAYELTIAELQELMEARVASWCGIA